MRNLFRGAYENKTVLVTGHTGFKGSWLTLWLRSLGAKVVGYSLEPPTEPNLFTAARVGEGIEDLRGDVRDFASLAKAVRESRPDLVFHLAALSIVRESYLEPLDTYATNIMGTVHVLEAVRQMSGRCCIVNITSDKCYDNRGWAYAYRENDPMGGNDPYSSSKGCAELAAAAYRHSFFPPQRYDQHGKAMVVARSGNVIGGGDWAVDRLVPDLVRSVSRGEPLGVRNPASTRPWQHVLEPLSGYLWLGAILCEGKMNLDLAWNFGPHAGDNLTVREVVEALLAAMGRGRWVDLSEQSAADYRHEESALRLDCTKSATVLKWRPVWTIGDALQATARWYQGYYEQRSFDAREFTLRQMEEYCQQARRGKLAWACDQ